MQFNAIYGPPWPPTPNPENWQAACFIIMPEHMQNLVAAPQRTTTLIKSGNNAHFRFNCACECVCVCLCVCVWLCICEWQCACISEFQDFRLSGLFLFEHAMRKWAVLRLIIHAAPVVAADKT